MVSVIDQRFGVRCDRLGNIEHNFSKKFKKSLNILIDESLVERITFEREELPKLMRLYNS